ncbi:MAG TPA: hypothetical protein VGD71_04250 [Kribbella sp.]|jgi:hypothetical protein
MIDETLATRVCLVDHEADRWIHGVDWVITVPTALVNGVLDLLPEEPDKRIDVAVVGRWVPVVVRNDGAAYFRDQDVVAGGVSGEVPPVR